MEAGPGRALILAETLGAQRTVLRLQYLLYVYQTLHQNQDSLLEGVGRHSGIYVGIGLLAAGFAVLLLAVVELGGLVHQKPFRCLWISFPLCTYYQEGNMES